MGHLGDHPLVGLGEPPLALRLLPDGLAHGLQALGQLGELVPPPDGDGILQISPLQNPNLSAEGTDVPDGPPDARHHNGQKQQEGGQQGPHGQIVVKLVVIVAVEDHLRLPVRKVHVVDLLPGVIQLLGLLVGEVHAGVVGVIDQGPIPVHLDGHQPLLPHPCGEGVGAPDGQAVLGHIGLQTLDAAAVLPLQVIGLGLIFVDQLDTAPAQQAEARQRGGKGRRHQPPQLGVDGGPPPFIPKPDQSDTPFPRL